MSPRNREKDQRMRERRRKEILDAALYAIARKGLSGTKMTDIAEAAGVSVGYVYKFFTESSLVGSLTFFYGYRLT